MNIYKYFISKRIRVLRIVYDVNILVNFGLEYDY